MGSLAKKGIMKGKRGRTKLQKDQGNIAAAAVGENI